MLRRLRRRGYDPKTLGGDKGYCLGDFPQRVLDRGIKPHLAVPDTAPAHSPVRRLVQSPAYKISQVVRKRVEEIFGWGESVAGLRRTKLKGRRKTLGRQLFGHTRLQPHANDATPSVTSLKAGDRRTASPSHSLVTDDESARDTG